MAIVLAGGLVIPASSAVSGNSTYTKGEMKAKIAKIVNGETDPEILDIADDALSRAVDKVNMKHVMDFTSATQADTNLVDGTFEYNVPTDFFAMREVLLIRAAGTGNDGEMRALEFHDWDQFKYAGMDLRQKGVPSKWMSLDAQTAGKIEVWPKPNESASNNYDIRVVYHQRIDHLGGADTDLISAPRELSEVLITYGWAHVLMMRDREDRQWERVERKADEMLGDFKGMSERSVKGHMRMTVAGTGRFFRPGIRSYKRR